jgi:hypothetical protein
MGVTRIHAARSRKISNILQVFSPRETSLVFTILFYDTLFGKNGMKEIDRRTPAIIYLDTILLKSDVRKTSQTRY